MRKDCFFLVSLFCPFPFCPAPNEHCSSNMMQIGHLFSEKNGVFLQESNNSHSTWLSCERHLRRVQLNLIFTIMLLLLFISVSTAVDSQTTNPCDSGKEGQAKTPQSKIIPYLTDPHSSPSAAPNSTKQVIAAFDEAAEGSFGPKGYFRIASPMSTTYSTDNLTLIITGEAINQPLVMGYGIDGQEQVLFSTVVRQEYEWDIFIGQICESIQLPPLNSGGHSITVFGILSGNWAQATVSFTIA